MGLNVNTVLFVLGAHRQGVRFDRTITVGRLLLNVYRKPLQDLLQRAGIFNEDIFREIPADGTPAYVEPLFRMLGAKEVQSLDVSDYEGATRLHNLNLPISKEWDEQYDVVCDGGTLEHVFNFPVALQNCMRLAKVGGTFFCHLPANNCMGHGFYQLSPDLFYRTLCAENGFRVTRMIVHAVGPYNRWYEVADPKQVGGRVELISWRPMHVLVQATKIGPTPATLAIPQQVTYEESDYRTMRTAGEQARAAAAKSNWIRMFPGVSQFCRVARHALQFYTRQSLANRRYFQPVPKWPENSIPPAS